MIYIVKSDGKEFETLFTNNSKAQGLFAFRVRDVNPMALKGNGFNIPKNPYDLILYKSPLLMALELKSTKAKSFSYDGNNPKIKPHQIKALNNDKDIEGVIAGFIFNFRLDDDHTYFLHIDKFNDYLQEYEDKKSIPFKYIDENGIKVNSVKKRTRYTYFVKELLENIIKEYEEDKY